MFKAPVGTKAKLKRISPNVSALLRETVDKLLQSGGKGSLCFARSHKNVELTLPCN